MDKDEQEWRERSAVYGGWREARTLEDVEEQERLVDRYAERHPGMVDQSDAAIARELPKMQRRAIERHDGPYGGGRRPCTGANIHPIV